MSTHIKKGFSFGLTSGIITTLGLMVGLSSSTHSQKVVIGGIIVIALADAMSDALGVHLSEESENKDTKSIWEATIATFLSKFVFAISFVLPVLFLPLDSAVIISVIWGLSLISMFSYYLARQSKSNPINVILEHVLLAVFVIAATHYIGVVVNIYF